MTDNGKPTNVAELVAYLTANPFVHCGSVHVEDSGPRQFVSADQRRAVFEKLAPNSGRATLPLAKCGPIEVEFDFTDNDFTVHLNRGSIRYAYLRSADDVPLVRYSKALTVGQVLGELNFACAQLFDESCFSATYEWLRECSAGTLWDAYAKDMRSLAVYPVRGGSEGHYVHFDLLTGVGEFRHEEEGPQLGQPKHKGLLGRPVGMCKTFKGMRHAQRIAATATSALELLM
jgi:hypothetical protein